MKSSKLSFLFTASAFWNRDDWNRKVPMFAPRQQGVVLVFSLVSLLVLTLLGVNMIQQNRLEFMMAGNAQTQTEAFATGEDILRLSENYVDVLHANNSQECRTPTVNNAATQVTYRCYNATTMLYDISQTFDLTPGQSIPDRLFHCPSATDEFTNLQAADEDLTTPQWEITNSLNLVSAEIGTTKVSIASVACITRAANVEVVCKDTTQRELLSTFPCNSIPTNCTTELYTFQVVSKTAGTSAERTVESKYAVRCDDNVVVAAP